MTSKARWTAFSLCASLAIVSLSPPVSLATLHTVALLSDQAPGLPAGETFSNFVTAPSINNDGHVAFQAYTKAGSNSFAHNGIWTDRSGSLQLFVLGGATAPGASPNTYAPGINTLINNANKITFEGTLSGSSINQLNDYGLWSDGSGSITKIARTNDAAPDVPSRIFSCSNPGVGDTGQSFCGAAPMDRPLFNDAGQAVIYSELYNTSLPSGTTHPQEEGLWSNRTGTLRKVVALGDSAPGTGGQFNIFTSEFLIDFGAFNNRGDIAFSASTNTNLSGAGVWISRGPIVGPVGQLDFVVGPGSSTNGVLPGVTIANAVLKGFNDAKQVAFRATLQGTGVTSQNDASLWRSTNGNFALIARKGQSIVGTGVTMQDFSAVSMNDDGMMSFSGKVVDASGSRNGIFTADENGVYLKALGGQQAPGLPTGVVFDNFIGATGNIAINGFGQVAFVANLTGPGINSTNDQGLWATDRDGILRLVVCEKGSIEYLPGQFGTVGSFLSGPLRSGNQEGDLRGINDQGQITFYATGSNFGWGVFVSDVATVPEPSTALLAAPALLAIVKTRRREILSAF
jgi:hypothetical protein